MSRRFSLVYPTRHRPDFVRQALGILEMQRHDGFDVIVSDNYVDPALSCEQICRDSRVANVTYVRPPQPVGMVENWNHALQYATGDYVCFLTDKMFVLPGALGRIERAIDLAGRPEIVSWTSDAYNPVSFADYFGRGVYFSMPSDVRGALYQPFSPAEELDRRGKAAVPRGEQSTSDYCRGKLVFGAYRRDLVQRIVGRYAALFHNISPDYTSMVLGLTEAHGAIELAGSYVVQVNTDISNGQLCDTSDAAALAFLDSLAGGAASILPNLFVPGLYVSLHNMVAHDFLALKKAYDLSFEFNTTNWLVYCYEDIYRPGRRWSDPRVEVEQKQLLEAFTESLEPAAVAAVQARIAARAASKLAPVETPAVPAPRLPRRLLRRTWQRLAPSPSALPASFAATSIHAAVEGMVRR